MVSTLLSAVPARRRESRPRSAFSAFGPTSHQWDRNANAPSSVAVNVRTNKAKASACSRVQLDRARRLAIYRARGRRGRAAILRADRPTVIRDGLIWSLTTSASHSLAKRQAAQGAVPTLGCYPDRASKARRKLSSRSSPSYHRPSNLSGRRVCDRARRRRGEHGDKSRTVISDGDAALHHLRQRCRRQVDTDRRMLTIAAKFQRMTGRLGPGPERDFALLFDGLSAEREQGITIDVAYRYFSVAAAASLSPTRRARAIPRNMVTAPRRRPRRGADRCAQGVLTQGRRTLTSPICSASAASFWR